MSLNAAQSGGAGMEVLLQILIYGLLNGAVLALNAISVTVVYSTVRTLNLAHGDLFALTTAVLTTVLISIGVQATWPPLLLIGVLALALLSAIALGAGLNISIERLAFKPFRGRSKLAPLIATLGLSFILYQVSLVMRTLQGSWIPGEHRSVPGLPEVPTDRIPDLIPNFDLVRALGLPVRVTIRFNDVLLLIIAVAVAIGTLWFLKRTRTGRAIRACAQDPMVAQICGVNLDRTIRRAFAFGGALAGLAAFVFAMYYTRPLGDAGAESGLLAFAAAILGGIGNPIGALLAALLLGVFTSFSDYALSASWTPVLLLMLFIGLLLLRPTGIAGDERSEDLMAGNARDAARDAIMINPTGRRSRSGRWLAAALIALAVFPLISLALDLGWQITVKGIGIFILLGLGMNLLLGLAGVLDLGFAVSFGIGGYVTAILTNRFSGIGALLPQPIDFLFVVVCSMMFAGLFGALKGGLTRRLRSDYLAVATLALGLLMRRVVINAHDITGGAGGLSAVPPPVILGRAIDDSFAQYYLVFALVVIAALLSQWFIRSRTGRAWLASSQDELAAASSGINVAHYRLLAFVISSALAGLAGALYASNFAYVSPDMVSFNITTMTLTMVVLGGAGSVPGVILGALLVIGYDKLFIPRLAALVAQLQPTRIGAVPDVRGASFFNFGLALYLTVLWRGRRREKE
jgi:branched-chain amino acid transport system permease protein